MIMPPSRSEIERRLARDRWIIAMFAVVIPVLLAMQAWLVASGWR